MLKKKLLMPLRSCYSGSVNLSFSTAAMTEFQSTRQHEPDSKRTVNFQLGQVVATPAALETLTAAGVDPLELLSRHDAGDWGDLSDEDRKANEVALTMGERLLSSYKLENGEKVWIITEWDRSYTTILLPEDY
jgi:hypothetical protein